MPKETITWEDLQLLKKELLDELKSLIGVTEKVYPKPWLKNSEVKSLLNISSNTVQRLRISGKLRSTKIGGIHYYKYEDIQLMMRSASQ